MGKTHSSIAPHVLERLKQGTGARTDSELARLLGISQQSVSNARTHGKVPDSWVRCAAEQYNVNADWLFFGRGSVFVGPPPAGRAKLEAGAFRVSDPASAGWGCQADNGLGLRVTELEQQLAAAKEEALSAYRMLAQYIPILGKAMRDNPEIPLESTPALDPRPHEQPAPLRASVPGDDDAGQV